VGEGVGKASGGGVSDSVGAGVDLGVELTADGVGVGRAPYP